MMHVLAIRFRSMTLNLSNPDSNFNFFDRKRLYLSGVRFEKFGSLTQPLMTTTQEQ